MRGQESDARLKVLSILGLILMVAALFGLFATQSLFSRSPVVITVQAAALAHPSLTTVGLTLLVFLGALGRMLPEEHLVVQRYPEYAEYAARTKRMIPLVF